MKQENELENLISPILAVPLTVGKNRQPGSASDGEACGIMLNFHSEEFNYTDDLSDCLGNYRNFESLDGIVTADMLHEAERREIAAAPVAKLNPEPQKMIAIESPEADAGGIARPLTVISRGRTLIIDTDADRAAACGKLLSDQQLNCTLLVTKNTAADSAVSNPGGMPVLMVDAAAVTGAFGCFAAAATVAGIQKPLAQWLNAAADGFDIVLDLQKTVSFSGDRLPAGYYAPGADPEILREVLAEMPLMKGRFERPQFTIYKNEACFHGRSRRRQCRQCLDVCPVGAIKSRDRQIIIDQQVCQGCGACSLICPADAIRMMSPFREELLHSLLARLETRLARAEQQPTLIITNEQTAGSVAATTEEGDSIVFAVEEIGRIGLEVLLASLASGAARVIVSCGPQNPPAVRSIVERQIQMARAVLKGLDLPEDRILISDNLLPNDASLEMVSPATRPIAAISSLPLREISTSMDKRRLVRVATQYLHDQTGAPRESIELPAGSPFGSVAVKSTSCTMCMACAVICPSGALTAGGKEPKLKFIESRCHQCGLCSETCPEGAMKLTPRLLCSAQAAEIPSVINEVAPFRCIGCGTPFASRAMIDRMQEKLAGHRMYASERQMRRLSLCSICRTRDALLSEESSWTRR